MADITNIFKGGFLPLEKIITENTDLADPLSAFVDAAREAGIEIDDRFSPDGSIHRFSERDSKRGEKDGWAVLHLDGPIPVGVYGSFKGGGWEQKWTANIGRQMSFAEKVKIDQWLAEMRARRDLAKKAAQDDAARRAEDEVGSLADAADDHPYLVAKGVKAYGIKIDRSGRLVIPMINSDGEIQTYQRISSDGSKRYLFGGKKEGSFYEIRGSRSSIYVCEGYATGATVHEATGCTVFVAFDSGNLTPVAKSVRKMFPAAKMYIAADNDQFTDGNPGMAKAKLAAHEARAEVVYPVFRDEFLAEKPTDFNDLQKLEGIDAVRKFLGVESVKKRSSSFELVKVSDFEIEDTDFVIDGYIEADSLDLIYGEPGCGKSFVAIDMACCVASGIPWHGHEVKKGLVIYIAGEGQNGITKRFSAWCIKHGFDMDDLMVFRSRRAAQLYDMSVAIDVADSVRSIVDATGCDPAMIVIDTVARNMGGDENSTQDMNQFIEHVDMLLRHPYKAAVMLVHHSGKASPGVARGSTALRGALDAEYFVEQDGTSKVINMKNKKMKDGEVPPDKSFSINQIGLGKIGKKGEINGAYLDAVDISGLLNAAKEKREHLGKNEQKAVRSLENLVFARMKNDITSDVSIDEWRTDSGIPANRFAEVMTSLVKKKLVISTGVSVRPAIDLSVRNHPKSSDSEDFGKDANLPK